MRVAAAAVSPASRGPEARRAGVARGVSGRESTAGAVSPPAPRTAGPWCAPMPPVSPAPDRRGNRSGALPPAWALARLRSVLVAHRHRCVAGAPSPHGVCCTRRCSDCAAVDSRRRAAHRHAFDVRASPSQHPRSSHLPFRGHRLTSPSRARLRAHGVLGPRSAPRAPASTAVFSVRRPRPARAPRVRATRVQCRHARPQCSRSRK
jgi:hypothetical protein